MTPAQLRLATRSLREQLRALRVQLADARAQGESVAGASGEVTDTKDRAARDQGTQIDAVAVERLTAEIAAAVAALERIADGTYGACIDCGGAIDYGRLLVQPAAARCLRCQTQREHEGRSTGVS